VNCLLTGRSVLFLREITSSILLAAVVLGISGCATPLVPEVPRISPEQREYVKNYVVGQKKTVNVGDPMIKFQDYWVESIESPIAVPDRTVRLSGGLIDLTFLAGQKYPVKGRMTVDDVDYTLVAHTESDDRYRAALVKADGTLLNRVATYGRRIGGLILVVYELTVSDPTARLVREVQKSVKSTKGYQNFELLYTGANSNALTLTYREFSPEGLARVAFFQNLTYDAKAKVITFRNYRIAIESATAEAITFTVMSDGT